MDAEKTINELPRRFRSTFFELANKLAAACDGLMVAIELRLLTGEMLDFVSRLAAFERLNIDTWLSYTVDVSLTIFGHMSTSVSFPFCSRRIRHSFNQVNRGCKRFSGINTVLRVKEDTTPVCSDGKPSMLSTCSKTELRDSYNSLYLDD